MARRIPENRFDELIDAAVEVFIDRGYRRTQMSDIAEATGVAKGTLYRYVEGKDALFTLCLSLADAPRPIALPDLAGLPIATPPPGRLAQWIKARLSGESQLPALSAAVARARADDPRAELEEVLGELYDVMYRNRRGIKLIDRCMDHREIGPIWQTAGRESSRAQLERLIELRVRAGQLRAGTTVALTARFIVETMATWAVHIHWDRAPQRFDTGEARANSILLLTNALLP